MRGPAPASSAAICEPSSCTSNQPLPCAASASRCGALPAPSGAGTRTPAGAQLRRRGAIAVERLDDLVRRRLQRVDAQVDGRAGGERRRLPRPRARRRHAQTTAEAIRGMSPATCGGASSGRSPARPAFSASLRAAHSACSEPSATALTSSGVRPRARGAAPSASARGVSAAHARGDGCAPAQRVEHERADGGAVARAGKAVRLAPVGKGRRPPAGVG